MHVRRLSAWLFFVSLMVSSIWMLWLLYISKNQTNLRVDILDVGQGDAILITTPNQTRLLIDTGANQQVLQALGGVLPLHVRNLDAVLLTHPDLDHIGGAVDVFNSYTVPLLLMASSSKETDITRAVDEISVERLMLHRGDRIVLDSNHQVYAEVLAPDISWNPEDSNDLSIVLKLVYGKTCFMLTGDASVTVERALVHMYRDTLDCDVLKAGHHGSRTSTSDLFVGHVSPTYGVISSGKDNDFGHPHQEVLDILTTFNVEILRTDQQGSISFISDGKAVSVKKNRR